MYMISVLSYMISVLFHSRFVNTVFLSKAVFKFFGMIMSRLYLSLPIKLQELNYHLPFSQ